MTKLKTLKDIEDAKYCECGSNQGVPCLVCDNSYEAKGCIARDELRQEAKQNRINKYGADIKEMKPLAVARKPKSMSEFLGIEKVE